MEPRSPVERRTPCTGARSAMMLGRVTMTMTVSRALSAVLRLRLCHPQASIHGTADPLSAVDDEIVCHARHDERDAAVAPRAKDPKGATPA